MESKVYTDYDDQFPYLILIAFIITVAEFCILERKNKFLKNIRLFNPQSMNMKIKKESESLNEPTL